MRVLHHGVALTHWQIHVLVPLIRQQVTHRWSRQEFERRVDLVLEAAGMPVTPPIEGEVVDTSRPAIEGSAPCA